MSSCGGSSGLEEGFEEGVGCLVKGGFVIAFEVWVEIVAEGGRGDVEEAEPGEGGGPVGVWERGMRGWRSWCWYGSGSECGCCGSLG